MRTIEKNDINISKLFEFEREAKLLGVDGEEITVYMKLPGDEHLNRARVKALRLSKDFRQQLNDKEWEDREVYIPDASELDKEEIVSLLVSFNVTPIATKVAQEITIPIPKEPEGDASLEEQEEYQRKVDEYPELFNQHMTSEVTKRLENTRKRLNSLTKKALLEEYENQLVREHADTFFYKRYREYCCYFASFKDENYENRLFDKYESLRNSPEFLKTQLIDEYDKLEINAEELKKLRGAMR